MPNTLFGVLGCLSADDRIRRLCEQSPRFHSLARMSFGASYRFADMPPSYPGLSFPLASPVKAAGQGVGQLNLHVMSFDPTFAPPNRVVATAQFNAAYALREESHADEAACR